MHSAQAGSLQPARKIERSASQMATPPPTPRPTPPHSPPLTPPLRRVAPFPGFEPRAPPHAPPHAPPNAPPHSPPHAPPHAASPASPAAGAQRLHRMRSPLVPRPPRALTSAFGAEISEIYAELPPGSPNLSCSASAPDAMGSAMGIAGPVRTGAPYPTRDSPTVPWRDTLRRRRRSDGRAPFR